MKYEPCTRTALAADLPAHRLRRGDVAAVVECHAGHPGQERGCTLEVFTAMGEPIPVVTVREPQIEPLTSTEVLSVRALQSAA